MFTMNPLEQLMLFGEIRIILHREEHSGYEMLNLPFPHEPALGILVHIALSIDEGCVEQMQMHKLASVITALLFKLILKIKFSRRQQKQEKLPSIQRGKHTFFYDDSEGVYCHVTPKTRPAKTHISSDKISSSFF